MISFVIPAWNVFISLYASATKHLGMGMSVCLSVCLSICRLVSTQLSKKFGWHSARVILYRLCTLLVGPLAQYMFTHSHGPNTVRNRAKILAWAFTLQVLAVRWWLAMIYTIGIMGNESDQKNSLPKRSALHRPKLITKIPLDHHPP